MDAGRAREARRSRPGARAASPGRQRDPAQAAFTHVLAAQPGQPVACVLLLHMRRPAGHPAHRGGRHVQVCRNAGVAVHTNRAEAGLGFSPCPANTSSSIRRDMRCHVSPPTGPANSADLRRRCAARGSSAVPARYPDPRSFIPRDPRPRLRLGPARRLRRRPRRSDRFECTHDPARRRFGRPYRPRYPRSARRQQVVMFPVVSSGPIYSAV
jgi:hypothetical protein